MRSLVICRLFIMPQPALLLRQELKEFTLIPNKLFYDDTHVCALDLLPSTLVQQQERATG